MDERALIIPAFPRDLFAPVMTPIPLRLELRGIGKVYPGVVANEGIDLQVAPGEIHAVLGENGAGKSTLMKIIYGVTQPTSGEVLWEGQPVRVSSPSHARALGIGMVFQHFSLFDTLTVAQNVALALPDDMGKDALAQRITEVSTRYGLLIDPRRHVHALSVGERQRVEIVRCLLQSPRLLIMDEPTSVLTPQAVQTLFATLRTLAAEGVSILYISHKLDEIAELCHRATVLRGGRVTGECLPAHETPASMARLMIGKELPTCTRARAAAPSDEIRLRLDQLTRPSDEPFGNDLRAVSLDVHAGEIVGIAGVSGNGQRELLYAISGELPLDRAEPIQIMGRAAGRLNPSARRALGMSFVPEDRLGRGMVPSMSLAENAVLTGARTLGLVLRGFVSRKRSRRVASECIDQYQVACTGPQASARSLSGGNVQKFLVGRELMQSPKLLVVAQPTWGVDVGAAAFLRQALIDLAAKGCAILVVSEELDELFEMCDRIAVMADGRLSPARPTAEFTAHDIGLWMSGLWPDAPSNSAKVSAGDTAFSAPTEHAT
jgi:general nucleoside transport system ATP-binding protein